MSDLSLFRLDGGQAIPLPGTAQPVEKQLQQLIEAHMQTMLGVRFLATEYSTGKTHGGRIDSLGLDENNVPVIIEYKRRLDENVINQGLYYLDWLLDHKAEFQMLAMTKLQLSQDDVADLAWDATRLLCIAADFTKFDLHAVSLIDRNISLIRYKRFGPDLLLLELVNAQQSQPAAPAPKPDTGGKPPEPEPTPSTGKPSYKTNADRLAAAPPALREVHQALEDFITSLADDVQVLPRQDYTAYRRLRNFACSQVTAKVDPHVALFLHLDPTTVALEAGFTRDMRNINHWGTGNLEVKIRDAASLERAKALVQRAYEQS